MLTQQATIRDTAAEASLSILQKLLGRYHPRNFAVRLWDGTTWHAEAGQPTRFTMVVNHPGALRKMFWHPNEIALGEAYIYNDFNVEGEIEAAFDMANYLFGLRLTVAEQLALGRLLLNLPASDTPRVGRQPVRLKGERYSKERDWQAVTYHYNVSNEFFSLWLDKRMMYSCAYFTSPDDDLENAQERKLQYICRKLRLRRGERLLDIGCGWGGLVLYAAQNYGVSTYGITVSKPQAELANKRIREEQMSDLCRVEVQDWRDLEEFESYDKLVSVGMFEHVGEPLLPEYFKRAWHLLRPGGVFLNHGIGERFDHHGRRGPSFSQRYVFPDGDPVPISTSLRAAEMPGFEVRDVESLREHYVLTLGHWVRRLEEHHDEARRITDEVTYRVSRLYMAIAANDFQTGKNNVYQTLLVKSDNGKSGLPLTRADWYS